MRKTNLLAIAPRAKSGWMKLLSMAAAACMLAGYSSSKANTQPQDGTPRLTLTKAEFEADTPGCNSALRVVVRNTGLSNLDARVCAQDSSGRWECDEFFDMDIKKSKGVLVCGANGSYKYFSRAPGEEGDDAWVFEGEGIKAKPAQ